MNRTVRVALVVVGLAAVTYGTASLTGGWLGTPPWWERERLPTAEESTHAVYLKLKAAYDASNVSYQQASMWRPWMGPKPETEPTSSAAEAMPSRFEAPRYFAAVSGREWISGGVVAAGVVLVAFGAWPRRRKEARS